MKPLVRKLAFALGFIAAPLALHAQSITVAAAADLNFAFTDLGARFEKETGIRVKLVFGSSGLLFSQIRNGAPYDLYFSADADYPQKLFSTGQGETGTLLVYATGRIVLWVRNDSRLEVGHGLRVLLDPGIRKIAIANPQHAPYGQAAVAAMKHEGIYEQVRSKLVYGENISQAASFVESGNADAGILAISLVVAGPLKSKGRYVEIPQSDYPSIRQAAVMLSSSKNKQAARRFLDYIKQPRSTALLESYGFTVATRPTAQQEK